MGTTDGADSPRPWDSEAVEPVLPDLLGDAQNELSDDVSEQILATATEPDPNSADKSSIPVDDDSELIEDSRFVNPEEAKLFLDAAADAEDDSEEEARMEVENSDDNYRDTSDDGGDSDHGFDFDDLYSGDDNSDDDLGGVLS